MVVKLQNLCCSNCASVIEREVLKRSDVEKADFNMVTNRLRINFNTRVNHNEFFDWLKKLVASIEPDVVVIKEDEYDKNSEPAKTHPAIDALKDNIPELCGAGILLIAFFAPIGNMLSTAAFLLSYFLIGGDILLLSAKNILRGRIFDENFLMSIATIGAMALGDYTEAVAVMLFYKIGETLSNFAQNKTVRSIDSLLKLKVSYANVLLDGKEKRIACEEVKIGDTLLIKPGEQVPVDGVILSGTAYVDTKSITGEPVPAALAEGDKIFAGYIVTDALLKIEATASHENSMIAKIIYLTREASQNKAQSEKFITKFARYYTPVVVFAAVAVSTIPVLLGYGEFAVWLKRGLIFLVISCPCALVLSIPLGYFAGIGAASQRGILIKGSNFVEALSNAGMAVFDKTGTITQGNLYVSEVVTDETTSGIFKEYMSAAENNSNHPIAKAIKNEFKKEIDASTITEYKEIAGKGIMCTYKDIKIKSGNASFVGADKETGTAGTAVHLSADGEYMGYVLLNDKIRPEAAAAVRKIKQSGIKRTVILSGDAAEPAKAIAAEAGIDEVYANLLPHEKIEVYRSLQSGGSKIYIGDGINDAPVLSAADVGIAMGAIGSDAAIEAADVVIMSDNLNSIAQAVTLSRYTKKIMYQNIVFILFVKFFFLVFGAFGMATMWQAVFADVGTTLAAVLNIMRIIRKEEF